MKYTLRQLEVFLATARHENLSRAAESLSMSQSAASDSLKELENQFDIKLFDRVGKRLKLNDFGRVLQPRAEELLERARELEAALGRHQALGALRVGATHSIGNYLAIPLIVQYRRRFPAGRISLDVDNTERITDRILHFELDVGLIEGEVNHPDLEITRWQEDELVVFGAPGHPLAGRRRLGSRELTGAQWILREPGSGTRQTFDRAMHDLIPDLQILLELEHTEAIKRAVESGLGIGCLSQITLQEDFDQGRFVPLALPGRDLRRSFYLIMHKDKYRSAALRHWVELCLSQNDVSGA